ESMKHSSHPGMTVGERRGLIALLTVILIAIGVAAICNHFSMTDTGDGEKIKTAELVDGADSIINVSMDDSAYVSAHEGVRVKQSSRHKSRRDTSKKSSGKQLPRPRSPRDERVN
ncbi:MAG: hypothetical protein K2K77_04020, partial [Duncaniella sp.]|nr:hypothetical protein [Duncaniella sp.]